MNNTNIRLTTIVAGLILLPAAKEHPYLDPGSGSFILQMIIAGAAGALFVLRNQIGRLFGIKAQKTGESAETQKKKSLNILIGVAILSIVIGIIFSYTGGPTVVAIPSFIVSTAVAFFVLALVAQAIIRKPR